MVLGEGGCHSPGESRALLPTRRQRQAVLSIKCPLPSLAPSGGGGSRARAQHVPQRTPPLLPACAPLQVRLFEGEGSPMLLSQDVQASGDAQLRLQRLLPALVDVPLIMNTLRNEIKRAVLASQ